MSSKAVNTYEKVSFETVFGLTFLLNNNKKFNPKASQNFPLIFAYKNCTCLVTREELSKHCYNVENHIILLTFLTLAQKKKTLLHAENILLNHVVLLHLMIWCKRPV